MGVVSQSDVMGDMIAVFGRRGGGIAQYEGTILTTTLFGWMEEKENRMIGGKWEDGEENCGMGGLKNEEG